MLDVYRELANVVARGEPAVLATVIASQGSAPRKAGAKMLIRHDGTFVGSVGGGAAEKLVTEKAADVMHAAKPQVLHLDLSGEKGSVMICGGQMDIFLEPIRPPETLYLFGAGHIAQSTAALAKTLGLLVVVIDPRPEYNNRDRFPAANELVVEEYDRAFAKLNVGRDCYIVICTTGHVFDGRCLEFAVGTEAKYIGMMGSKKKVKEVKERLQSKGIPPHQLAGIHAPVGLGIGAETPEEIAVSILGEVIQVRRTASPGPTEVET